MLRSSVRHAAFVVCAGLVFACSAILGIEDTKDDPAFQTEAPKADGGSSSGILEPSPFEAGDTIQDVVEPPVIESDGSSDPGSDAAVDALAPPACTLTKPFGTPKALNINTTKYETGGRLTEDELTIYFHRRTDFNASDGDLYTATRPDKLSNFGTVTKLSDLNSSSPDGYLTTTFDEKLAFFASGRASNGSVDLYRATRSGPAASWSGVVRVATTSNSSAIDDDPFVLGDGRAYYFDSNRSGSYQIYRSSLDVTHTSSIPVTVSSTINTTANETEPVVTLDELTLYFARQSGSGTRQIYVSKRASPGSAWPAPTSVSELNSSAADSPTWISADGCRIVFSSQRTSGPGLSDIYSAEKPL